MADLEIRPVGDAEFVEWRRTFFRALGITAPEAWFEFNRKVLPLDRCFGAFDGPRPVGTAVSFPSSLTVPGGDVPMAAVTGVGVAHTHRRQGALTRMMRALLDDSRDRGEVAAGLIAAEWPIYGRFGFGPVTFGCTVELEADRARFAPMPAAAGSMRVLTPAEALPILPDLFEGWRRGVPGNIARPDAFWQRLVEPALQDGPELLVLVHDAPDGEPDGFAVYAVSEQRWEAGVPRHTLTVRDLVAEDPEVEFALWRHLADIDLIGTVKAERRPLDDPVRWRLADARRLRVAEVSDLLWVRPLDLEACLTGRRYEVAGALVLDVRDPFSDQGGRWRLDVGPDGSSCARTGAEADLTIDLGTLAGLWLGGQRATTAIRAGRAEEHAPGVAARADALFAAPTPFCATHF